MSDIFISYARADLARVASLAKVLERQGWSVWWDRVIPPGKSFSEVIDTELSTAKCVIVVWSQAAVDSRWVVEEADEGRNRRMLIPVLFDDTTPPLGFRQIHAAPMADWRGDPAHGGLDQLLMAVTDLIGTPAAALQDADHTAEEEAKPRADEKRRSRQEKDGEGKAEPAARGRNASRPKRAGMSLRSKLLAAAICVLILIGAGVGIDFYVTEQRKEAVQMALRKAEAVRAAAAARARENAAKEARMKAEEAARGKAEAKRRAEEERRQREAERRRKAAEERRRRTARFPPGKLFKDCTQCPSMVVIPGGSFQMGSNSGDKDEKPVHRVTVRRFAMGQYEVTFMEWDACVAADGCSRRPGDGGWGRGRRPVINVSWKDAKQYVAWLNRKTGKHYRLPSESEWEYAARAGTRTKYWWGNAIGRNKANCDGCGSRWGNKKTAPVGSFRPNRFGLYDVHGNVWEWVEDCWHNSYLGAPPNGGAWTSGGDCRERVLRGGSWVDIPGSLLLANRDSHDTGYRDVYSAFRVARTLP